MEQNQSWTNSTINNTSTEGSGAIPYYVVIPIITSTAIGTAALAVHYLKQFCCAAAHEVRDEDIELAEPGPGPDPGPDPDVVRFSPAPRAKPPQSPPGMMNGLINGLGSGAQAQTVAHSPLRSASVFPPPQSLLSAAVQSPQSSQLSAQLFPQLSLLSPPSRPVLARLDVRVSGQLPGSGLSAAPRSRLAELLETRYEFSLTNPEEQLNLAIATADPDARIIAITELLSTFRNHIVALPESRERQRDLRRLQTWGRNVQRDLLFGDEATPALEEKIRLWRFGFLALPNSPPEAKGQ